MMFAPPKFSSGAQWRIGICATTTDALIEVVVAQNATPLSNGAGAKVLS
jgi:hypothetical protein